MFAAVTSPNPSVAFSDSSPFRGAYKERIVTMTDYTKLRSCELFLFDMDGTLYLGDNVYPGAIGLMELTRST